MSIHVHGFWEVFWTLGRVFGFWEVFGIWILGSQCFRFWEVFSPISHVLTSTFNFPRVRKGSRMEKFGHFLIRTEIFFP